jgi:hypothetical protein
MPAVNWDQPSDGSVSNAAPSLLLRNDQGGALMARSKGDAVEATSKGSHAVKAYTLKTLTARLESAKIPPCLLQLRLRFGDCGPGFFDGGLFRIGRPKRPDRLSRKVDWPYHRAVRWALGVYLALLPSRELRLQRFQLFGLLLDLLLPHSI